MQFNSLQFLFCFLPIFLTLYYLVPQTWRTGLLVAGSLLFYSQSGSNMLLGIVLLLGTTVFTFSVCQRMRIRKRPKLLAMSLLCLLGVMVFFKCYDDGRLMPVGMSFFLFQQAAYLIEVFRGELEPEWGLTHFAAQTMMFPKVLMGPLMNPVDLQEQVGKPRFSYRRFHKGLQELILGLGLKVLLADRIGGLWTQASVIGYESISTAFAWLSLIAFAMRLFFDFWGYSIMAVGLGHMLGFHLPQNFLDPYASGSVSGFWRRWHATLGTWFREYLYIPLGGSRCGTWRTMLNLLVVWLATGLWHGVGGNYLLWAMFVLFFIVNERLWLGRVLKRIGPLRHVYTVMVILVSWVPFAIGDWNRMILFGGKLFGVGTSALNPYDFLPWLKDYIWLLLAGTILATPIPRWIWEKIKDYALTDVVLFILLWVSVYFICTSAQDPFLYFRY